jgi:hypothetical protein
MIIDSYTLSALCDEFCYVTGEDKIILFGIRGSLPLDVKKGDFGATSAFSEWYEVGYTKLNYTTSRCSIGVWDKANQKIALFPGSTVPSKQYLLRNKAALKTFNILSPGKYELKKGIHPREKNAYQRHEALLMDDYGLISIPKVSITGGRLKFGLKNAQNKVMLPGDNLHASRTEPTGIFQDDNQKCLAALNMHFSSSGCITIVGQPKEYLSNRQNDGSWNSWMRFKELLTKVNDAEIDKFSFLLFNYADFTRRKKKQEALPLRYGASGNDIRKVQRILTSVSNVKKSSSYYSGPENGLFTEQTVVSLLEFQEDFFNGTSNRPSDLPGFFRNTRHFM